jgi:mono/diheme cytochrome c family protein
MTKRIPFAPLSLLAVLTAGAFGCRYDGTGTKMQWAPDMADAPTVKSQESYVDPPPGSVAMSALLYPATVDESEAKVAMPEEIAKDDGGRYLEQGKGLFNTFCIPCHGADAKGHGSVGPNVAPPDITGPTYQKHADGFFFYRITFGTSVMPSYGHAISAPERWMIIKYLRTLQH